MLTGDAVAHGLGWIGVGNVAFLKGRILYMLGAGAKT